MDLFCFSFFFGFFNLHHKIHTELREQWERKFLRRELVFHLIQRRWEPILSSSCRLRNPRFCFVFLVSSPIHSLPTTLFLLFLLLFLFRMKETSFIHSFIHSSLNTYTSRPIRLQPKNQHDNTSAHHIHIFHAKKKRKKQRMRKTHHIIPSSPRPSSFIQRYQI